MLSVLKTLSQWNGRVWDALSFVLQKIQRNMFSSRMDQSKAREIRAHKQGHHSACADCRGNRGRQLRKHFLPGLILSYFQYSLQTDKRKGSLPASSEPQTAANSLGAQQKLWKYFSREVKWSSFLGNVFHETTLFAAIVLLVLSGALHSFRKQGSNWIPRMAWSSTLFLLKGHGHPFIPLGPIFHRESRDAWWLGAWRARDAFDV